MKQKERVGLSTTIGYACGNTAQGIQQNIFNAFIVVFLNTVIGIPALTVGLILLITRVAGAFADLVFSMIGDRTHTKLGSYRPWVLSFAVPTAVFLALSFAMPDAVVGSTNTATVWAFVLSMLVCCLGMTIPQTSLGALAIIACPDDRDKNRFGFLRTWGQQVGGLLVSAVGTPLLLKFSGTESAGAYTREGFAAFGVFAAVIAGGMLLICGITVKERIPVNVGKKVSAKSMFRAIGKNPIAWGAVVVIVAIQCTLVIAQGLNSYIFVYVFGRAELMAVCLSAAIGSAVLVSTFITPTLIRKVPRKIYGPIVYAVLAVSFALTYIGTGIQSPLAFIIGYVFSNVSIGICMVSYFQVFPDAAVMGEYISGVQVPGLVNALSSFASKVAMGVGSILITVFLNLVHFDASLGTHQAESTLLGIRNVYSFGCLTFVVVGFIGFLLYSSVKQDRIEAMKRELTERAAAAE